MGSEKGYWLPAHHPGIGWGRRSGARGSCRGRPLNASPRQSLQAESKSAYF